MLLFRMFALLVKIVLVSICGIIQTGVAFQDVTLTDGRPLVAHDTKFVNLDNLRVRKVNKTHHLIVGTFEVFRDINNNFEVEALPFKKAGNAYKKTPFHIGPKKACEAFREGFYLYPALMEVSDLPPQNQSCPIPKKLYHINGLNIPIDNLPKSLDGDFLFEIRLLDKNGDILNGYQMLASFIYISSDEA